MELFDLEIPIRSTGGAETRAEFKRLESDAVGTAARSEAALNKLVVPPQQVGAAMRKLASDTVTASDGLTRQGAMAAKAAADATALADAQRAAGEELRAIAGRVASAKAAFASGSLSATEFQSALAKARTEALALNTSLGGVTRSQAPAFNAILQATATETTATGTAMARLDLDVKQASAAFKAGTLSLEGYQVALATARAEAIALSQSGVALTARETTQFNRILSATEPAAKKAVAGLGTMRSTASTLASQLLGVKTSVGQVTGALGQMAIGTGLTIGILAGVTAIAAAYRALTARSREQKEATDNLREAWKRLNDEQNKGADAARAVADKDREALRKQVQDAQAALEAAKRAPRSTTLVGGVTAVASSSSQILAAENALSEARRKLAQKDAELAEDDARREVDATEKRIAALLKYQAAGLATADMQTELRKVAKDARTELNSLSAAYLKTADGAEHAEKLIDRFTSIEAAFNKEAKAGAKEQGAHEKALRARTEALLALQLMEGPTVERWRELKDRAKTLRDELQQGNLVLAARKEQLLSLTDPKLLRGLVVPGNIDLNARPIVHNKNGSISTVRSMSFEEDGREVLIPTVSDEGTILSDENAIARYQQTGKHLGKFSSIEAADVYARALHEQQAMAYGERGLREEVAKGNLTLAERVDRLRELQQIEEALTKATSAVIPNQGRLGLPAVPTLQPAAPTFPTTLRPIATAPLFGGFGDQMGGEGGSLVKSFTDAIVTGLQEAKGDVSAAIQESIIGPFAEKQQLLDGIGRSMGDSLKAGLTAVVTGGLAAIITGNGDVLLQSLGSILTQMGEAMTATGIAMLHLLPFLSNPFTSGPALIAAGALIAGLGLALSATATGGSGGSSSGAGGSRGASFAPITTTTTVGVSNTAPAQTGVRTAPSAVATAGPAPTFNFTVIGPNDPAAQRQIVKMVNLGMARGV